MGRPIRRSARSRSWSDTPRRIRAIWFDYCLSASGSTSGISRPRVQRLAGIKVQTFPYSRKPGRDRYVYGRISLGSQRSAAPSAYIRAVRCGPWRCTAAVERGANSRSSPFNEIGIGSSTESSETVVWPCSLPEATPKGSSQDQRRHGGILKFPDMKGAGATLGIASYGG